MVFYTVDVTASLNRRAIINHDLVYFDEIGFTPSTGLICSGVASDSCCRDDDPVTDEGLCGHGPSGVGSWIYPDSKFVRRESNGSVDAEYENFQIHRTKNTNRNRYSNIFVSGIYRCEIPLNISADVMPLILYVGIYKRGNSMK